MSDDTIDPLITYRDTVDPADTQPFAAPPDRQRRKYIPAVWAAPGTGGGHPKLSGGVEVDTTSGEIVPRAMNRPDMRYALPADELTTRRAARAALEYPSAVVLEGADGLYEVRSASGNNYDVKGDLTQCDCPDWWRLQQSSRETVACKHIILVTLAMADPLTGGVINWSAGKVAQQAGVSVEAVRAACQQGLIAAVKIHNVWSITPTAGAELVFIFTPLPPALASLSPASIPNGSPDTLVAVAGENFCVYSRAVWDGVSVLGTIVLSAIELQVTVPAANLLSPGSHNVRIENAFRGGSTSAQAEFTVT